jgi:hypothetical protein
VLNANVGVGGTFEWDYKSTTNVSAGTKEEATVTLRTGTVGYHAVIEVYQDTIFKTVAFVSKTKKIPGESAVIFGTVTNLHRIPIFNERVDVIQGNGDSRTVFTNAQGIYRLFSIPEGDVHITVAGVTKVVTPHSNQKVELSFQVSKELS